MLLYTPKNKGFTPTPTFNKNLSNNLFKKNHKSWCEGFTLVELLVVIAIVGILASVVLASLNSARAKARDAQRVTSIRQVQNALEMYYLDNGSYPSSGDVALQTALTAPLTPTYIGVIPQNPTVYSYYNNNENPANWYVIKMNYETKTNCYVCGGDSSRCNGGYWGLSLCK